MTQALSALPEMNCTAVVRPPLVDGACQPMLVKIYPPGPGLGACFSMTLKPLILGRDADCDIHIPDSSVSRKHAEVEFGREGCRVLDLGSTNGTYVNDRPINEGPLVNGDYLRVGGCIYRFLASGNIEAMYHEEVYRLTIIDALTDVPNKRHLTDFLERELYRTGRYGRPLSAVLFDVDRFKALNDRLGHLGGDFTLRELAALVRAEVRRDELFARYGGEEFALVLPETAADQAAEVSERIRKLVENHTFSYEDETFGVTISMGVATTTGETTSTPHDLLAEADAKLYRAKAAGRNCVIC